jgi:hypothetical protein
MPLGDLSPLAYFKELHLVPRVIFAIGGILFFAGLFSSEWRIEVMLFGVGLIFVALAWNFFLNAFWQEPGPPYAQRFWWGGLAQAIPMLALSAVCLYVSGYTYRHEHLPPWLQPLTSATSAQKLIVGKWKEINGPVTLQFFPDGTLIFDDTKTSKTETYSFPDETHIKILEAGQAYVVEVKVSREALTVHQNDKTMILNRVP